MAARAVVRVPIFVGLVAAAAVTMAGLLVPASHPTMPQVMLAGVMALMAVAAIQFPLLITPKTKVNTSSAVYFTAALVLPPGLVLLIAGSSQLVGGLILARRRNPLTGRPRRNALDTVFNTSQWIIAASGSSLVFSWLVSSVSPDSTYVWFIAMVAAGVTMYLSNTAAVAAIAAIQTQRNLIAIWLDGRRVDAITEAGLYTIGAVASVAVPAHPWVLLGLVVPTILLHTSLQRTLQLQRQTVAALEQMADLVDIRDGYTGQHSVRVADCAEQIARRMKVTGDQAATIRLAARVHDIGKIAIPDKVLHRPGRLEPAEWELMKSHVEAGCRVLERFDDYARGVELVRCHHERIDGTGYPRGLKGKQIPMGAQIVGIADAIDAMTSDRPYRRAMRMSAVVAELDSAAGTQFSREVVEAALDTLGVESRSASMPSLKPRAAAV